MAVHYFAPEKISFSSGFFPLYQTQPPYKRMTSVQIEIPLSTRSYKTRERRHEIVATREMESARRCLVFIMQCRRNQCRLSASVELIHQSTDQTEYGLINNERRPITNR